MMAEEPPDKPFSHESTSNPRLRYPMKHHLSILPHRTHMTTTRSLFLVILIGLVPAIAAAAPEPALVPEAKGPRMMPPVSPSWFRNMKEGSFVGKASGLLVVDVSNPDAATGKSEAVTRLVPLQCGATTLSFIPDEHEIYDASTKVYSTPFPNGKFVYNTYNGANALAVTIGGDTYEYSHIDGGCDEGMPSLKYEYLQDEKNEYLILVVEKPIRFNGGQDTPGHAMLKTGSVLVFSHERPKSADGKPPSAP